MPGAREGKLPLDKTEQHVALSPVDDDGFSRPRPGVALCLSGGGYRAMIFHLGVLWRLNELGYLARLDRISSVSGGSITAGLLGLRWGRLDFAGGVARGLVTQVVEPIRAFAHHAVDVGSVLKGGWWKASPWGGLKSDGSRRSRAGESTGGNADEAATATASNSVGRRTP